MLMFLETTNVYPLLRKIDNMQWSYLCSVSTDNHTLNIIYACFINNNLTQGSLGSDNHKSKELVCFKGLLELRSRPPVGVLPDIRMGSKVDLNLLATGY